MKKSAETSNCEALPLDGKDPVCEVFDDGLNYHTSMSTRSYYSAFAGNEKEYFYRLKCKKCERDMGASSEKTIIVCDRCWEILKLKQ